jgi:hypothetical protein
MLSPIRHNAPATVNDRKLGLANAAKEPAAARGVSAAVVVTMAAFLRRSSMEPR